MCRVPKLTGLSLAKARSALGSAHCALGHVTTPRNAHGKLVVGKQSVKAGTVRAAGTKVSLTLRAPAKPGKHTR